MALWTFLAFAGGDDDEGIPIQDADGDTTTTEAEAEHEDRTTTTRRRRPPTTTTTAVLPGAPLLGEPTGLGLVVAGGTGRVIDLDTGGVTRVGLPVLGVSAQGLLVQDGSGIATWPAPYDGSGSTTILPIELGTVVEQVWVVGDGRLVWAVAYAESMTMTGPAWSASLVDVDGAALGGFDLPEGVGPFGATDHGLLVTGPGGVYLLDAGGHPERVSRGEALDVVGQQIHVLDCDEDLQCQVEVFDGRGRRVGERPPPVGPWAWGSTSPDGRLAFVEYRGDFAEQIVVTVDEEVVYQAEVSPSGRDALAWSPDGRWLAIASQDGIHVLDTLGGTDERRLDLALVEQDVAIFFVPPAG
jgi:hypothetical protein